MDAGFHRAVVELLREAGVPVRALVRDMAKAVRACVRTQTEFIVRFFFRSSCTLTLLESLL